MLHPAKDKNFVRLASVQDAEGPCVTRDGRIFMVSSGAGKILEVLADGTTKELANKPGRKRDVSMIPAGSADRVEFLDDRVLIYGTALPKARAFRYAARAVAIGAFLLALAVVHTFAQAIFDYDAVNPETSEHEGPNEV